MNENILYINTSTDRLQLALYSAGRIEKYVGVPSAKLHNSSVLVEVEKLFVSLGLSVKDLDLVAVVIGPGSFTGIRIGVSTALALSRAVGAKAVGVTSLEVAAFGKGDCLVALDCLHGNYYLLKHTTDLNEYTAGTADALAHSELKVVMVGDDTLDSFIATVNDKIDKGLPFSEPMPFYLKKSSAEREAK